MSSSVFQIWSFSAKTDCSITQVMTLVQSILLNIETMEEEINKFKKSLSYQVFKLIYHLVRGILVKILQGIETQLATPKDSDQTINEIIDAFESIKRKIDYIAQKRIDE
jgi:hypothetical protein